ncbi:hypothetical protein ACFQY9_20570 [Microvirga aerilata]|uniref:hypothetical protein n=1 Tax=Microvirga aerilata TaxID=670292 RepID=UPI00363016E6
MPDTLSSTGAPVQNLRLTARALLLGDRLDVAGLERSDVLSTTPSPSGSGRTASWPSSATAWPSWSA